MVINARRATSKVLRTPMSRSKRFVTGLLSSYAAIGVNMVYTIASIPLALHYLDKEEFGLWALVTQLGGYLMLLEFGMSGSISRALSDHKDNVESGIYGNILRTGARVFAIQGVLVGALGLIMAWLAPSLLNLPAHLQHPFMMLMGLQALINGTRLALGALGSPLWCHQRLDLTNLAGSISLVCTFALLWLGFELGWQLYSLPFATAVGFIVATVINYISCRRLGYYPPPEHRGHYDPKLFRELFHFGGSLFMMNLGVQLTSASQVIIVSRLLGMEAATTWSVSTKLYQMGQQVVARILDSSAPALTEIIVRGDSSRMKNRFRDILSISAVVAAAVSAGIALTNGAFIEIWTSGRVTWEPWNNVLLACILFSTSVTRCHTGLVGITKQIGGMKYIYLFEGLAFVAVSLMLVPNIGLTGLLVAALVCNLAVTGAYGVGRTGRYFGIPRNEVVLWIARPTATIMISILLFSLTCVTIVAQLDAISRLSIGTGLFFFIYIPALWLVGMNLHSRIEATTVISRILLKAKARLTPA